MQDERKKICANISIEQVGFRLKTRTGEKNLASGKRDRKIKGKKDETMKLSPAAW